MRYFIIAYSLIFCLMISCKESKSEVNDTKDSIADNQAQQSENIYQFEVADLYGSPVDWSN